MSKQTQTKIQAIRNELSNVFSERNNIIEGALVAALAGETMFLLGPPGTAKSALCEAVCEAIGGNFFGWLMAKTTTPDELFGPFSLKSLEQDRYARVTKGKLPEATVAFLDEIFKGSSAVLNTLLPVINERVFYNDGKGNKIPLKVLFSASNELPQGEELDALWDRFTLRYVVNRLQGSAGVKAMLKVAALKVQTKMTPEELEAEQAKVASVVIPDAILDLIISLRQDADRAGIYVSDRKWRKIVRVLQAKAHLEGRTEVEADDLDILCNILWREPTQAPKVRKLVSKVNNPIGEGITKIMDAALEVYNKWKNQEEDAAKSAVNLKTLAAELDKLGKAGTNKKLDQAVAQLKEYRKEVAKDLGAI